MKTKIQLAVLLYLLILTSVAQAFTKELTSDELQTQLSSQFPLHRQSPLINVTLSDPRVVLKENSDRIGMELTVLATALGNIEGKARGLVDGKLHYEPRTGEFFLLNPELHKLHVDNVSEQYQADMRLMVEGIIQEALARIPIYTLQESDPRQSLARSHLESVIVRNGKLVLNLKLF